MNKIYKLEANVSDVMHQGNGTKNIEIYAFARDENNSEATLTYEMVGNEEQMFVYDGVINTEDPGEGPAEEYANRQEALSSEYGNLFKVIFDLTDNIK